MRARLRRVRHPFRRKNLTTRLLPFYAAVVVGFVLARPTPISFAVGGALVLLGAALRGWGGGHLVKNDRLVVTGPYAHLQHPLYAGTLLLGTGFGIVAGTWGIALVAGFFLPLFFKASSTLPDSLHAGIVFRPSTNTKLLSSHAGGIFP